VRVYLFLVIFLSTPSFACEEGIAAFSRVVDSAVDHDGLLKNMPSAVQAKYANYPKNPMREGLGDLADGEVAAISKVVNDTEVPFVVVGSSTIGRRRGLGTLDEIGHGPGTKSDIDYVVPSTQAEVKDFFQLGFRSADEVPQAGLPSFDRFQGLGFAKPDEDTYRIWFQPGKEPVYLKPGDPNLPMFKVDLDPAPLAKTGDQFPGLKLHEKEVMGQPFWIADGYKGTGKMGYVRFDVLETTKGLKFHQGYDLTEPHIYIDMVRGDPAKPGLGKWLMDKVTERYPNHLVVSELAIKNESAVRKALLNIRASSIDLSDTAAVEKLFGDIPAVKVAKGPYKIIPKFTEDGLVDHFLIVRRPASQGPPRFEGFGEYAEDPRLLNWMEGLDSRPKEFFETQEIKNRIK
jgi:hypothetical protein